MTDSKDEVHELYEKILQVANFFLKSSKTFSISVLKDFDPSFEDLANIMEVLADIVHRAMIDEDPLVAQKAIDYVYIMQKMALAVRNNDSEELSTLVDELDRKPFV